MNFSCPHRWDVTTAEARDIQTWLRPQVSRHGRPRFVDHVGGVDISIKNNHAVAAVVVLRLSDLALVDVATVDHPVQFPYVPGLLSFREIPPILAALTDLSVEPDLLLLDGQGVAHPRRCGLASHLGVILDKPTIGCAKSRLIGDHDEPDYEAGCYVDLVDGDELVGAVLRTRTNVKPIYVSVGHRVELPWAIDLVWRCCAGFRLPEPTRLAHQAAGKIGMFSPGRQNTNVRLAGRPAAARPSARRNRKARGPRSAPPGRCRHASTSRNSNR